MNITIRGTDRWGNGGFHAPRGNRHHNGVDIVVNPHQKVLPLVGGKVSKIGFPYDPHDEKKGFLRYVQIDDSNGLHVRYFYLAPCVTRSQYVCNKTVIGLAEDLTTIYPGITNHYHFEVLLYINDRKVFVNPIQYLIANGHKINGFT